MNVSGVLHLAVEEEQVEMLTSLLEADAIDAKLKRNLINNTDKVSCLTSIFC